jgi:hypothetical protein
MNRAIAAVGLLVLSASLAACGRGSSGGEGTVHSRGVVRVAAQGEAGSDLAPGSARRLRSGDEVTVASGLADVKLPGGGRLELRRGSWVRFSGGPQLRSGDLLVQSTRRPVDVQSPVGVVSVAGAARLRRDLAVAVGSYEGATTVAAERTVSVSALQEDTVPSAGVVPEPSPIQLHAADPWDQRFLGTAIDLTGELNGESSYVTANTPTGQARTAAFYQRALRPLAATPSFTDALLRAPTPQSAPVPPGDALVAAAIALGGHGPFADRWRSVFTLRSEGAEWGVVVLDEHADPKAVLGLVGGALDNAALAPAALTSSSSRGGPAVPTGAVVHPVAVAGPSTSPSAVPGAIRPNRATDDASSVAPTTVAPVTVPGVKVPTVTLPPPIGPTPIGPTPIGPLPTGPLPTVPPVTLPPGTTPVTLPPLPIPPVLAPVLDPVVNLINALGA